MRTVGSLPLAVRRMPLAALALVWLAGCGGGSPAEQPGGIRVADAWARSAHPAAHAAHGAAAHGHAAGTTSAVYLSLRNGGDSADRVVGASTPVAELAEIHRTDVVDGVARMRHVEEGIPVAAGETVELRPGGYHIMLIGVNRELAPGDSFTLTLLLERTGEVWVEVAVRDR